jgi:anhydro-N-acetylmuramic acid kinase
MNIVGLMSGTSLDGLDIALCHFDEIATGKYRFEIMYAQTISYPADWVQRLQNLPQANALTFVQTDRDLGKFMGEAVAKFCRKYQIRPSYVASHGHTIFHQPHLGFTAQIGHGASLAAAASLPVVCDFRSLDVALGGQGAPLVPIGDQLLFSGYDFCLNLGGIANVSFQNEANQRIAFDICPVNMVLNFYAEKLGKNYDDKGRWAAEGTVNESLLAQLNALDFYAQPFPKSLGREWVSQYVMPLLENSGLSERDVLATFCRHIAMQIAQEVSKHTTANHARILVTGGGAFNVHLLSEISQLLPPNIEILVPNDKIINFKEALIFAFLGFLRVQNQYNCLSSVTGARQNNVGGCVYEY